VPARLPPARVRGGGASARQGAWFLQDSEQGWLVGGEERGSRFLSASFPDEDAACRYLLDRLTRPDPYSVGYTLAELEERRAFTQSSLESLRPTGRQSAASSAPGSASRVS